jgi:hypothetical protein
VELGVLVAETLGAGAQLAEVFLDDVGAIRHCTRDLRRSWGRRLQRPGLSGARRAVRVGRTIVKLEDDAAKGLLVGCMRVSIDRRQSVATDRSGQSKLSADVKGVSALQRKSNTLGHFGCSSEVAAQGKGHSRGNVRKFKVDRVAIGRRRRRYANASISSARRVPARQPLTSEKGCDQRTWSNLGKCFHRGFGPRHPRSEAPGRSCVRYARRGLPLYKVPRPVAA